MITLDVADLVVIAGRTLRIGSHAALSQIDVAAAQAALTEGLPTSSVIDDQDAAAAAGIGLMHALLRHRPFHQHAEQIAVAAALQFLSLNGWQADFDPPAAAAVVVEALASGHLSPVRAAAWLSPRLAADTGPTAVTQVCILRSRRPVREAMLAPAASILPRKAGMLDPSASRREPSRPTPHTGLGKAPSVIYPQVLLFVQAGFWTLGAVGGVILFAVALAHGAAGVNAAPFAVGWSATTCGLAAAKLELGLSLDRRRSRRTRRAVIATELAMTGFGVLWLSVPAYGFIILGLSGAVLSLAAVLCMIRPRARQYFTGSDAVPGPPDPDALPDPVGFWGLALTSRRLAIA